MGALGSAEWSASVTEPTGRIVWSSGMTGMEEFSCGRDLSDVSSGSVTFLAPGALADRVEPWIHALNIFADDELVWQGMTTEVTAGARTVVLEAEDPATYMSRRRVPTGRRFDQEDASRIMAQMFVDAMAGGDPLKVSDNLLEYPSRIWAVVDETANAVTLDDVVKDLVSAGLEWTVYAGRLLIGPGPSRYTTQTLSDVHLGSGLTVVKDGRDVATDVVVIGKGVWGHRAIDDDRLGIQSIVKADSLTTVEECEKRAEEELKKYSVAPRRIVLGGSVSLSPESPVQLRELIPGVRVPVSTEQTGVLVASDMVLDQVRVSGDSGGADVAIGLTTPGLSWEEREQFPPPKTFDGWSPYEKEKADKDRKASGSTDEGYAQPGIPM